MFIIKYHVHVLLFKLFFNFISKNKIFNFKLVCKYKKQKLDVKWLFNSLSISACRHTTILTLLRDSSVFYERYLGLWSEFSDKYKIFL